MTLTQYDPIAKAFDLFYEASQDSEKATSDEIGAALNGENIYGLPENHFTQGRGTLKRERVAFVADAVPKKLEELVGITDEALIGKVAKAKSTDNFDEALGKLKVLAPVSDYEKPQVTQDHDEYRKLARGLTEKDTNILGQFATNYAPEGWERSFAEASRGPGSEVFLTHFGTILANESMKEALSGAGKTKDYLARSTTQTLMGVEKPEDRAFMTAKLYLDKLDLEKQ